MCIYSLQLTKKKRLVIIQPLVLVVLKVTLLLSFHVPTITNLFLILTERPSAHSVDIDSEDEFSLEELTYDG